MTSKYRLETFGKAGDPFNPRLPEALLHAHAEGIDGPTCVEILQPRLPDAGDPHLWPARVAVAEPGPEAVTPSRYAVSDLRRAQDRGSKGPRWRPAGEPGADKPDADAEQP